MADPTHRTNHHPQQQQLQQKGQEAVDSFRSFLHEKAPSTSQTIALATLFPVGAFLLFLAGLALTGSVLGLAVTAPLFVIFSPVIVPAALTIGLAVTGFLASGAFGITGLSAFSWIVNYFRGYRTSGGPGMGMGMGTEQVTRRGHEMAREVGQKTKEAGREAVDSTDHHPQQQLQQKVREAVDSFRSFLHEKAPSTSQVIAVVTLFPVGAFLLFVAGLALTGSVLGLAVTAPLFVIFSPVIVPAALTIALAVTGFLASGAFGITGLSAFSWIVNYFRGYRTSGGPGMEQVTRAAFEMARDVGQKTKEVSQQVSGKAREGTRSVTT